MECLRVIGRVCRTEDTDPWLPDCRPHKECTESPTSPLYCTVSGPETKLFMEANGFLTTVHDDIGPAHCILAVCMHSSLSFIRHAPTASNLNINVYLNLYVHVCRLVCFYMCLSVAVCSPLYPWHAAQPWLWNTKCSGLKKGRKVQNHCNYLQEYPLTAMIQKDTGLEAILNPSGQ